MFSVVEPLHHLFTREGDDLVVQQEVSLEDAICGVTLQVRHMDGSVLQVEVQPMQLILENVLVHTFWGKGMPRSSMPGAYGDLIFRACFTPPSKLPRWQQVAIREVMPGGALKLGPPLGLKLLQGACGWVNNQVRRVSTSLLSWLRDGS